MRSVVTFLAVLLISLSFTGGSSQAEVDVGLSLDSDGIKGFYLSIGEHYNVPEKQVIIIKEKKIPDEELPVVFFLAGEAGMPPDAVIKLRLGGKSWMEIALQFGLTAKVFYVPIKGDPGPPYGKAYGHFKKHKKEKWGSLRLADDDIINFVNLRFVSSHHGLTPEEVIKMRAKGTAFVK
ncbi:MAG: hypothetical protein DRP45_12170, partial [Candidatus Zixiibacteriota bacterium]